MKQFRKIFRATHLLLPFRLPSFVIWLLRRGTQGYSQPERQGLIVANATGYLASLSSISFAITYQFHDPDNLQPLVIGNLVSAVLTAATPLVHRFGIAASGIWLSTVIFSTIFYFIAMLGRDSGIQLNYIGAAAAAIAVLGTQRMKLAGIISLVALVCHLATWYLYPAHAAMRIQKEWFLDQLYANSAISVMAIVFLVVFYAFRLTRLAEAQTDALLYNMMPEKIVQRLKEDPTATIADAYDQASVLFSDLKGFTTLSSRLGPSRIVMLLDELFTHFDQATTTIGMEKIKTIGDAYMAVAGVPDPRADHAEAAIELAKAMLAAAKEVGERNGYDLNMRIGIASGPVMAGIIGQAKFSYDVWGDTVNLASRLESAGEAGRIHVCSATREALQASHRFTEPVAIELKGFGSEQTAFLELS
jgi:adenylate cyclase